MAESCFRGAGGPSRYPCRVSRCCARGPFQPETLERVPAHSRLRRRGLRSLKWSLKSWNSRSWHMSIGPVGAARPGILFLQSKMRFSQSTSAFESRNQGAFFWRIHINLLNLGLVLCSSSYAASMPPCCSRILRFPTGVGFLPIRRDVLAWGRISFDLPKPGVERLDR